MSAAAAPRPRGITLVLVAAQVCFGSLPVAGRMALARLPADGIVITRMTAGAIAFYAFARARSEWKLERRDLPMLILLAILGVVANQLLFIHGLARSTATNAAVLGSTIPVFTALFAIALAREPVLPLRLAGIGVAFVGALVLVGVDGMSTSSDHLLGDALVLANSASYGLYLVLVRRLAVRYPPITLISILFLIGVPLAAPLGVPAWAHAAPLSLGDVGFLAFLIAVPTLGAYSFTQIALRHVESSLVASYIYLQPLFAAIGAAIFLGERPGVRTAIAAACIFAGVALSTRAKPRPITP